MATFPEHVLTVHRVLDATAVTDAGVNTSLVECRGAKQVIFVVRASNAEDTDTFIPPSLIGKVASDADTIATPIALSATVTNILGLLAGTIPGATQKGSEGYIVSLFPEGLGTEAGTAGPTARIGCHSVGLFVDVTATHTLTDTVVDAIVIWN